MTQQQQQEDKKTWRQRFSELIWKPKAPTFVEKKLSGLGVDVLSDQKLEHRIGLLVDLQDDLKKEVKTTDLKEYVGILKGRTDMLHRAVFEIAMPYASSGSYPYYAKMLDGWLDLHRIASSWILIVEDTLSPTQQAGASNTDAEGKTFAQVFGHTPLFLDKGIMDNQILIRFLHDALQKHVWSWGFAVLGKCFRDKDVTERAAIVIESLQRGPIPLGTE